MFCYFSFSFYHRSDHTGSLVCGFLQEEGDIVVSILCLLELLANYMVEASVPTIILICVIRKDVDIYVVRKAWIRDNPWIGLRKPWIHALRRQSMDCPRPNMIN